MAFGTLAFDTLSTSGQISGTAKTVDSDYLASGSAKVWIKLDMNAQANDDSFNVASITDNALGDFTVTITNDMNNVNYSITGMASRLANSLDFHVVMTHETTAPAAGLYRLRCANVGGSDKDGQHVMTAVHGDLA